MRTYERNGIHIDQCTECRGIFLDRGELEHLINAENTWAAAPAQQPAAAAAPAPSPPPQQHGYDNRPQHGYDDRREATYYDPKYDKKRKKRNFLEDLFD